MTDLQKVDAPLIVRSTRCGVAFQQNLVIALIHYEKAPAIQESAELLLTPESAKALIGGLEKALARLRGSN